MFGIVETGTLQWAFGIACSFGLGLMFGPTSGFHLVAAGCFLLSAIIAGWGGHQVLESKGYSWRTFKSWTILSISAWVLVVTPITMYLCLQSAAAQTPSTSQQSGNGSNFIVPGSGNTFNIVPPQAPAKPQRDPDGIYQLGHLVGKVKLPQVDLSSGVALFGSFFGVVDLNETQDIQYRDLILHIERADASTSATMSGVTSSQLIGVVCKIVGRSAE